MPETTTMTQRQPQNQPPAPTTTINMNVSLQDVVGVAVAEAEKRLRTKQKELMREYDALRKTVDGLEGAAFAALDKWAKEEFKEQAQAATDGLKAIGYKKGEFVPCLEKHIDSRGKLALDLYYYHGVIQFHSPHTKIPVTAELRDMAAPWIDARAGMRKAWEKIEKLSAKLKDVPALERQAKAEIVKRQMGGSRQGKAIVNDLMRDLSSQLDLIGRGEA